MPKSERVCLRCKKPFLAYGRKSYCSRSCYAPSPIELTCFACGKKFLRKGWRIRPRRQLCGTGCRSLALRGSNSPSWKGGGFNRKWGITMGALAWRKAVYARDGYTCRECGARGVKLHAHHVFPKALFPWLADALWNGVTLCVPCHEKTESYQKRTERFSDRYAFHLEVNDSFRKEIQQMVAPCS